eukprot:1362288-Amorphochlora_amoeboformis.AAC.1
MMEPDGIELFHHARRISKNVAYFVPKNTQVRQLVELGAGEDVRVEGVIAGGKKLHSIVSYYGPDFV